MTANSLAKLTAIPNKYMTIDQLPQDILNLYPAITSKDGHLVGILSYMGPIDADFLHSLQQELTFPVNYFDQPAKYTEALTKLRAYLLLFLMAAALALLALMTFRYGILQGLKLAAIPIITAMSALALSHFILGYVTIFNLLACILIIALSVDYVVFLIEHGRRQHVIKAISLSAATSGIAFGMFVFSSTPAILQFGLTILIGVIIAWSLCLTLPTSLLRRSH
jgi:predicted exporter